MAGRTLFGVEDVDARFEKPRRSGMTEIRGPCFSDMAPRCIQDILQTTGQFVDGLKFTGGSASLMSKSFLKEITNMAHEHGIYVSSGDWAENILTRGPSSFKHYVQNCKDVGFDVLELNMGYLNFPEEELLRLIRLVKREGLKAKPQIEVQFWDAELTSQQRQRDMDALIKMAERLVEAGADMIMVDADSITKTASIWHSDLMAKLIGRLGLQKVMFEANDPESAQWFIDNYGSDVNLFIDHSHVTRLECLRLGSYHSEAEKGVKGFNTHGYSRRKRTYRHGLEGLSSLI